MRGRTPSFHRRPKERGRHVNLHSILDGLREFALNCTGSPHSRSRQLAALRRLDAHLLRDIGLTAEEAARAVSHRAAPRREALRSDARRPGPQGQVSLTR
jgi:uncharacterized protein YjiS (DUF1127 family)